MKVNSKFGFHVYIPVLFNSDRPYAYRVEVCAFATVHLDGGHGVYPRHVLGESATGPRRIRNINGNVGAMSSRLVRRHLTELAEETLADTPITVISGARQVGKSTLMNQLLTVRESKVVTLDNLADREAAGRDPDAFVDQYSEGTFAIDEVHRVPNLMTALKANVDKNRRPGRFLITGSANLMTLRGSEESLAGRAETIPLEGFSQGEVAGKTEDFVAFLWELPNKTSALEDQGWYSRNDYLDLITRTCFPGMREGTVRTQLRRLRNYVQRVLSKDTTDVTGIAHPDRLEPLLQLIAARNSGEFVATQVGREIRIPERSVPTYLNALKSVYLVRVLPGWSNNVTKRAVATPKVSVADPGLAAFLAGVDAEGLRRDVSSTLAGGFLEAFVLGEITKQQAWSTQDFRLSHFRDNHGNEVDIVVENRQGEVAGIEVKISGVPRAADFRGMEFLRSKVGDRFKAGVLLHTGTRSLPFGDRLWALPISSIWEH